MAIPTEYSERRRISHRGTIALIALVAAAGWLMLILAAEAALDAGHSLIAQLSDDTSTESVTGSDSEDILSPEALQRPQDIAPAAGSADNPAH
ncbi:hypothetical protein OCH7691_02356 [Oceanibacterium hippocampi]|uniref:Uncharacterized protein n=2 Tax=Oceanibacterium hippocampi TaxID=745714 RepID=A0A1Y5T4A2_9PROT|nr:hypothetical protein OCH7691_02356 [Oceanibacterium hippocampi]